ncbi:hypothetical protein [Bacillus atrophaeus]|uniref:hypothetical protein n=1 Tax=Bacillus atrophaeus TaxID=1452 RepID=UPI0007796A0A|nr:hypothetical protein [Bacillus atrophaeus]KYD02024.1 hypothetical protein B4144_2510 [Bacillus atrophaeus]
MAILDIIENHEVYIELEETKTSIDYLLNDKAFNDRLNQDGLKLLNRTKVAIDYFYNNINSTDSLLLTEEFLDNLKASLHTLKIWLENEDFITDSENYPNWNEYIDTLLKNSIFIPISSKQNMESIRESATSFRRSIGGQKAHFEKELNELNEQSEKLKIELASCIEKVYELGEKVDQKIINLDDYQNTLHQNFLEKQSERSDSFDNLRTKLKESFEEFIEGCEENFDEKVSELEIIKEDLEENLSAEQKNLIDTFKTTQNKFLEETKSKQIEYDKLLNEHKQAVEELVGIISTNSIAGHHKEVADKAGESAKNWQRLTVISFIATIGFSIIALFFQEITTLSWPNLVAKFFVIGSLGSLTAYTAKQAKINQELEFNNRTLEVELKTLNPYIATFENKDQEAFKKDLFPKIFGRSEKVEALSEKEYENLNINIIEKLINVLEKQSK